jgi:hypothetical protein
MSQVTARWRRIPFAASLREFILSRGRRTSWPSQEALEQMDDRDFEAYIHAIELDTRIATARADRGR